MTERPPSDDAFTLTEMLVVILIIGALGAVAGSALTQQDNAMSVDAFTHKVLVAMRRARNLAADSGAVVRLTVRSDGQRVTMARATTLGLNPPSTDPWISLGVIDSGNRSEIYAITSQPDMGIVSPSAGGLATEIRFNPDDSATPATVYFRDTGAKKKKRKILIFGMTGYAHSLTRW